MEKLTLANIEEHEPLVARRFESLMEDVAKDIRNRPMDLNPREVTLKIVVVPEPESSGNCEDAKVTMKLTSKIPEYRSRESRMGVAHGGLTVYTPTEI